MMSIDAIKGTQKNSNLYRLRFGDSFFDSFARDCKYPGSFYLIGCEPVEAHGPAWKQTSVEWAIEEHVGTVMPGIPCDALIHAIYVLAWSFKYLEKAAIDVEQKSRDVITRVIMSGCVKDLLKSVAAYVALCCAYIH